MKSLREFVKTGLKHETPVLVKMARAAGYHRGYSDIRLYAVIEVVRMELEQESKKRNKKEKK